MLLQEPPKRPKTCSYSHYGQNEIDSRLQPDVRKNNQIISTCFAVHAWAHWGPEVTVKEQIPKGWREKKNTWVEISCWHPRLSAPLLHRAPVEAERQGFCAALGLLRKLEWGKGVGVCAVAEVQFSALCLAPVRALLVHSMLSCRVMDLFPTACGTSGTESAWAALYNYTKPLKNDAF